MCIRDRVKNCVCNRSRPDEIDTETEIWTSLKFEFYFRFRWPPSTKSMLISYISFGVFVTIRVKIGPPQSQNCQNRTLHISKIGKLRVRTEIIMLFSRIFQDLQRQNSRVFQDTKILFSRTFQDTFHSQTWVAWGQKSAYTKSVISLSALQQRIENAIPKVLLFYLTV